MDVSETSGNREVGRDSAELLVDLIDVLGLCVQRIVIHVLVIHSVFFSTCDTNFHFEPLLHGRCSLKVFRSGANVVVDAFLRKIDHVAGEKWLAVLLEIFLVCVEHTIEPVNKGTVSQSPARSIDQGSKRGAT